MVRPCRPDPRDEAGDIIAGWLLRLVLFLAVVSVVLYEIGAVVVATVGVDDAAAEVARVSADAYRSTRSPASTEEVAAQVAAARDVELLTVEIEGTTLEIEVARTAGTLVLHRIPAAEDLVERRAGRQVEVGS